MLRPTDFVIDASTPLAAYHDAVVNGEPKGRGAVPRDFSVQPKEMFDPPSAMSMIPRSEWSERIRDLEATQSALSHIRGQIPSLDQGQVGYCVTADTEVLTEHGWVAYPQYNWTDPIGTVNPLTHALEFQRPFQRHVYEYDGPMIYSTNRRIDFGVTPDHEMYVRRWDERARTLSDRYSFVRAGDLGWYSGLLAAPSGQIGTELVEVEVPGDRRYDGDDFLALMGLVISDGYAGGTDNTRNWVSFASFREESRHAVAALAARVGFRECPSRPGVWIRYDAGALAAWVRENCYEGGRTGARAKRVPGLVKWASGRQIRHFLSWFDDRNRAGTQFYSTSKGLIDDLQELHLRIGRRSTIGWDAAKDVPYAGNKAGVIRSKGGHVLTVSQTDRLCLERKRHIETDRYKGLVYCAAVPNHTLLTRRNGSVLVSSNCWAHSTTHAVMLARAVSNQPYVPLSAYAVAATIKQGRNEGGWGPLSAQFIRDRGVPSQALWPQGDRNYRQYDKPEVWANAALHKITEDWVDLNRQVYDRNVTFDQLGSGVLSRQPGPVDYNHWGHSICACDLVDGVASYDAGMLRDTSSGKLMTREMFDLLWMDEVTGGYGLRIWNSWSDGWGDRGMGVLAGQKAVPDGAMLIRAVSPSIA